MSEQAYLEAPYSAQDRRDEQTEIDIAIAERNVWALMSGGVDEAVEILNDHGRGLFGFCAAENLAGDIAQHTATVIRERGVNDESMTALGSYVMTLVRHVVERAAIAEVEK